MKVEGKIGLFLSDKLRKGIGKALREGPVGNARIAPVEVAPLLSGKLLPRGGMNVDVRGRPFVDCVGQAGSEAERPPAPVGGGEGNAPGMGFLGRVVGEAHDVRLGYDDQPSLRNFRPFEEQGRRHH